MPEPIEQRQRFISTPAEVYDRLQALTAGEEFRIGEAYPLIDEVAVAEGWNDPALDAYERLDPRKKL